MARGFIKAGKDNKKNSRANKRMEDCSHLEHSDCEPANVGDSCIHIDTATDYDVNACSRCGHNNEKKAKHCSVCGKKL